jgi:hypothetical protein
LGIEFEVYCGDDGGTFCHERKSMLSASSFKLQVIDVGMIFILILLVGVVWNSDCEGVRRQEREKSNGVPRKKHE